MSDPKSPSENYLQEWVSVFFLLNTVSFLFNHEAQHTAANPTVIWFLRLGLKLQSHVPNRWILSLGGWILNVMNSAFHKNLATRQLKNKWHTLFPSVMSGASDIYARGIQIWARRKNRKRDIKRDKKKEESISKSQLCFLLVLGLCFFLD